MKIDLKDWKEFELKKLFKIKRLIKVSSKDGGYVKDHEIISDDGSYPYIAAVSVLNGIKGYTNIKPNNKGNCITFSTTTDSATTVFYQPVDFVGRQQMVGLYGTKDNQMNIRKAMFLIPIIRKNLAHFNYDNKLTYEDVESLKILLPAKYNKEKKKYEPDWEYMETYVRDLQEINRNKLELLEDRISLDNNKSGGGYNQLDITDWHEFKVKELFHIRPTKHHNLTNAELFDEDGTTIVVVNSSYDNGVGGKTLLKATEKAPMITFSDTTNADSIFLQTEDFAGYSHIQCLNPLKYEEKWNETTLMFFLTVFRAKAKTMNYDYSNKFTRESSNNLIVPLPAIYNEDKDEYEPDWEYMENYIEERKRIIEEKLRSLKIWVIF